MVVSGSENTAPLETPNFIGEYMHVKSASGLNSFHGIYWEVKIITETYVKIEANIFIISGSQN